MKVFTSEKPLEKALANNKTFANLASLKVNEDKSELLIASLNQIKEGCDSKVGQAIAKIVKDPHPDLMYGSAILVSTVINRNDDVFLPEHTWAARNTPINTPYNDEHVENDIIGHIIAARPLDESGNVIEASEPPDYFDIEVDFVVYKSIFPAIAKDIYDNAPIGKKFVSMECYFQNFDYVLIDNQGKGTVVSRNEETAFLTKYLRAYGGEGTYKDYKIGRALKDFRFSGMGNVDKPANSGSKYTKIENYSLANANIMDFENSKVVLHVTKGKTMKIENLDQANQVIAQLTEELEALKQEKTQSETNKALETLKAEKTTVEQNLATMQTSKEVAEQELTKANTKITELENTLKEVKANLDAKTEELDKINVQAKLTARVTQLKDLGVDISDEQKESIAKMTDEGFAQVIEFTKKISANKTGTADNANTATDAATKVLDTAKTNDKPAVDNTSGNDDTGDKVEKTAAKLVEIVRKNRKNDPKSKNS